MKSATGNRFSIFREGEFKEESCEWQDIEAMCRAGSLSPNALVFFPDENVWKKIIDTELAACFEHAARPAKIEQRPPSDEAVNRNTINRF